MNVKRLLTGTWLGDYDGRMLWILQDNLYREAGYLRLTEALDRLGLPHMVVKPVPFSDRLIPYDFDTSHGTALDTIPEPVIPTDQPIFVSGSYTLAKIANQRGWKPGAYLEGLRYDEYASHWRPEWLLNPNAIITTMRDAAFPKGWKAAFIKPVEDSKAFSGRVFGRKAFEGWQREVVKLGDASFIPGFGIVTGETEIILSKPVKIYTETRLWVVDGRIATASGYKVGDRVTYSDLVDQDILDFGDECIKAWVPNRAFVLDIARTEGGLRIVEVNNLNSAGLYAADVGKLVGAVEGLTTSSSELV